MQWGGCLCIKNQEPDDEKPWFSDPNLLSTSRSNFNHKQFAEFALVKEAGLELRSRSVNDMELYSPNIELIFGSPPQKSVPYQNVLVSSPRKRFLAERQLPTLPSVIYPAAPSPSATWDESVVSCLSYVDHGPELEFLEEDAEPQANSSEGTIILASEKGDRTPSLIFHPFSKEKNLCPITTSVSFHDWEACSRSSYLEWDERECKNATESSTNYTIAAKFDSSECSEFDASESTYINSLYPTESDGSNAEEQDCIWVSFIPVTPKGGCTSSISSSGRTSSKTSKREHTTWESSQKNKLHNEKASTNADQSDSTNEDRLGVIV